MTRPSASTMTARVWLATLLLGLVTTARAAEQTWTGQISDSACGAKHEEVAENQGKMPDPECTKACIRGGSKYVFVVEGKVYQIANQDDRDLGTYAGQTVKLTGELTGRSIVVSKIQQP